jgi:hypothetical protein
MRRWFVAALAAVLIVMAGPARADDTADRLAAGMERWKRAGASGRWWSCGVAQEDGGAIARELAGRLVDEAAAQGQNPWGLAGMMAKESAFDECALGKRSRDLGYEMGILKRNRLTISHTRDDVLAVLASKRWRQEIGKADMGLPQVMYPTIYRGDPAALLTREVGVQFAAAEMARRARRIGAYVAVALTRPWSTWPGWYDAKYDASIVRYARALGATEADLPRAPKGRAGRPRLTSVAR